MSKKHTLQSTCKTAGVSGHQTNGLDKNLLDTNLTGRFVTFTLNAPYKGCGKDRFIITPALLTAGKHYLLEKCIRMCNQNLYFITNDGGIRTLIGLCRPSAHFNMMAYWDVVSLAVEEAK